MDNMLFEQLNREEAILIEESRILEEKLRALRDFRTAFFAGKKTISVDNKVETDYQPLHLEKSAIVEPPKAADYLAKNNAKTTPEKVLYTLALIKTGRAKDVASKLMEIYPEYQNNEKKANKHARYYLSASKIKGEIEAFIGPIGPGKTYRYYQ